MRLLLQVDTNAHQDAAAFLCRVPAITRTDRSADQLVAHVRAPYEGQLAWVLETVRRMPGLRTLRVV